MKAAKKTKSIHLGCLIADSIIKKHLHISTLNEIGHMEKISYYLGCILCSKVPEDQIKIIKNLISNLHDLIDILEKLEE